MDTSIFKLTMLSQQLSRELSREQVQISQTRQIQEETEPEINKRRSILASHLRNRAAAAAAAGQLTIAAKKNQEPDREIENSINSSLLQLRCVLDGMK